MPSILEVKQQIGSITNTRKITKAMQLVATSRMKHLQKKAISVRDFAKSLIKLQSGKLADISLGTFSEEREASKRVFILYSSDKGLCGGMNQQLVKTLLASDVWNQTPEPDRIVITFGRKGRDYLKFRKIKVDQSITDLPDSLTPSTAYGYIDDILKLWKDKEVGSIHMVAPHYKNSFVFYPIVKQFLPVTPSALSDHLGPETNLEPTAQTDELIYFEPTKSEISQTIAESLVHALFLQAFYELKATEYSSRMIAMQNASNSAENIIGDKTRLLNRIRQQKITQEIAEITGSATVIN
ncbi:MAG: ATP synthase F1 subunit gamma [Patescibacteria group bacterium]